jgi:hypothetical protein
LSAYGISMLCEGRAPASGSKGKRTSTWRVRAMRAERELVILKTECLGQRRKDWLSRSILLRHQQQNPRLSPFPLHTIVPPTPPHHPLYSTKRAATAPAIPAPRPHLPLYHPHAPAHGATLSDEALPPLQRPRPVDAAVDRAWVAREYSGPVWERHRVCPCRQAVRVGQPRRCLIRGMVRGVRG